MNKRSIFKKNWRGFAAVVIFTMLWEFASRLGMTNKLFVSMPSDIIFAGYQMIESGMIVSHFVVSLETLFAGFISALVIGVSAGIIIGYFPKLYDVSRPFLFTLNSLPVIAMIPLVILWFGVGSVAQIFVIFFMALIPILINTIDGARRIDSGILNMVKSLGANNFFILRQVVFPGALPYVFTGIRSAIGKSIVGMVIAQAFGYGKGLGYLVAIYGGTFQTARLMALIAILFTLSLTAVALVGIMEKRMFVWQNK